MAPLKMISIGLGQWNRGSARSRSSKWGHLDRGNGHDGRSSVAFSTTKNGTNKSGKPYFCCTKEHVDPSTRVLSVPPTPAMRLFI
ncbi:unnamed protein product, partial [Nesidiocoris tenuis]